MSLVYNATRPENDGAIRILPSLAGAGVEVEKGGAWLAVPRDGDRYAFTIENLAAGQYRVRAGVPSGPWAFGTFEARPGGVSEYALTVLPATAQFSYWPWVVGGVAVAGLAVLLASRPHSNPRRRSRR